jgi:hypothetical protein
MKRKSKRSAAQMRAKASVRKTTKPAVAKRTRSKSSRDKVRAYRARMRAKGLRLVQMWVPDKQEPTSAEPLRQTQRRTGADAAAIRKAWAEALTPLPHGYATSFDDIADLAGSVDGLPSDLASNKDKYLRAGYGRKRHR